MFTRRPRSCRSWGSSARCTCPSARPAPDEVYELAKRRGMDFVTITDHDTIDGALDPRAPARHVRLRGADRLVQGRAPGRARPLLRDHARRPRVAAGAQRRRRSLRRVPARAARSPRRWPIRSTRSQAPLTARHRRRLAQLFPIWETRNGSRAKELNLPAFVYIETHGGTADRRLRRPRRNRHRPHVHRDTARRDAGGVPRPRPRRARGGPRRAGQRRQVDPRRDGARDPRAGRRRRRRRPDPARGPEDRRARDERGRRPARRDRRRSRSRRRARAAARLAGVDGPRPRRARAARAAAGRRAQPRGLSPAARGASTSASWPPAVGADRRDGRRRGRAGCAPRRRSRCSTPASRRSRTRPRRRSSGARRPS